MRSPEKAFFFASDKIPKNRKKMCLERITYKWKDNSKMDVIGIIYGGLDWIHLA
jgi:hypothetical protein